MNARGFILAEVSVFYVVFSIALMTIVPYLLLLVRANRLAGEIAVCSELAFALLEEIRLRRWDENTPPAWSVWIPPGARTPAGALGPEAEGPQKPFFDDVDDFQGWLEEPPLDPAGEPIEDLARFQRSVTVSYWDPETGRDSGGAQELKRVQVCARGPRMRPVCLDALFSNR